MHYVSILIAGFGGGFLRGLVGYIKHHFSYKNVKFDLKYFIAIMFMSGIVGLMVAVAIRETDIIFLDQALLSPALAFVFGYAGGDFLENIYKIIVKKSSLY
jgi:hypothetical protein